jgi:hypothetical protein
MAPKGRFKPEQIRCRQEYDQNIECNIDAGRGLDDSVHIEASVTPFAPVCEGEGYRPASEDGRKGERDNVGDAGEDGEVDTFVEKMFRERPEVKEKDGEFRRPGYPTIEDFIDIEVLGSR